MADNKEYEILIDGEDDIEVETDSVSYLPFDNKTINQNSKGEMQAIGITNGTDIIDYATIKAGIDKPAPQPFEFETKKDFEDWLSGTFTREDGRTVDDLLIGNDVYIVEKNVPDYWCKSVIKPFSIDKNFEEMETDVDNNLSNTSINPVQNKVITGALNLKQDTLTAGENITIQNNVISANVETIKTFSGGDTTRDNNREFYDFITTLNIGDYFWLDRLNNDHHNQYSTVAGKILMQLVSVPERYTMPGSNATISKTSKVELLNCFKLLAKGFTYQDKAVNLKDGPFTLNYNIIHKYDLTADLNDTKEYELYFAEHALVGNNSDSYFDYSFVGVSTTITANKPSTKVITRLDATNKIEENNGQAVTSGAVYTALQGKQATLTSDQLNAVNSGATEEKINQIATNTTNIALKQNKLSDVQLSAVNSGITDTKVAQIATNTTNIASLQTGKQDKLTAGENITIENNVISAKGGDLTNYYTKEEVNSMLPFSEDISGGNV